MTDRSAVDSTSEFDDELAALANLLDAEGIAVDNGGAITPRDPAAPLPMSFSQELIWLLDRATPGMTAYNMPLARRLTGSLDFAALEQALSTVTSRHEALRTRFEERNGAARQIVDPPSPFVVNSVDLSAVPDGQRASEAQRIVRERFRTPFDLEHEPGFRVTLVRLADEEHVLVLESHHIVVDGWSLAIVLRELSAAYAAARTGKDVTLPVRDIQYGDYAVWQRRQLTGERLEHLLSFWRTQLADVSEPLALQADYKRASVPTQSGGLESIVLDHAALADVRRLAHARDATLYMTLLAAYGTVLHRYTGRQVVLIGSGSAGRTQTETEGLVGYFNNMLVQRTDFSGDPTFGELLERVRESSLGAYDHQDIPFEKLVREIRQGAALSTEVPLFEVVLTMQDTLPTVLALDGLEVATFGADLGATKFDITLFASERDEGLMLTVQYRSDLFAPETMRRFLGHLKRVLAVAAVQPELAVSKIAILTPDEVAQLQGWNATSADEGAAATLVQLFEAQASRVPNRDAVVVDGVTLTYGELNSRANQLAHHLRASGAERTTPVGLLLDRSAEAIVGLLGILKAGCPYVPLAVDAPQVRLALQVAACGARWFVTTNAGVKLLPPGVAAIALDDAATVRTLNERPPSNHASGAMPADLAYVLFTSGSTGTPKGVAVTHANAVHYARAISRVLGDLPEDAMGDGCAAVDGLHFAMASTFAADLGNTSLLPALLSGGTLHVLTESVATDPARFAEYLATHTIDVLKITPGHLAALIAGRTGRDLAAVLPRRWTVVGGEALRLEVARTLIGAGTCRILNHYGPTETTVGVCTFEATAATLEHALLLGAQTVPIGRPLVNTRAYVMDANDNDTPVGVPGELVIGGAGVAQGYLQRPDLTAERFIDLRGDRVYRTGDRVRRLIDGNIEFLGRVDSQVKVRGYRVELGEVEQVLRTHPGVTEAAVVLRADAGGDGGHLIAYIVPKRTGYEVAHTAQLTSETIREWLTAHLPEYMVPDSALLLNALPLTPNGKLDRARLPDPDPATAQPVYVAPRTAVETQLAAIWAEVLRKDQIGVTDNFLELGGHSLMAIRVLGKISKAFGTRLPLRTLFDHPTVAQLAVALEAVRGNAASAGVISARPRAASPIAPIPDVDTSQTDRESSP